MKTVILLNKLPNVYLAIKIVILVLQMLLIVLNVHYYLIEFYLIVTAKMDILIMVLMLFVNNVIIDVKNVKDLLLIVQNVKILLIENPYLIVFVKMDYKI